MCKVCSNYNKCVKLTPDDGICHSADQEWCYYPQGQPVLQHTHIIQLEIAFIVLPKIKISRSKLSATLSMKHAICWWKALSSKTNTAVQTKGLTFRLPIFFIHFFNKITKTTKKYKKIPKSTKKIPKKIITKKRPPPLSNFSDK